jgi:hypothetical protein
MPLPRVETPIVLTGDDVEQLTIDNWNTTLTEYTEIVYSRTTPEQKMMIVVETKKRDDNVVATSVVSFVFVFVFLFIYDLFTALLILFYCRLEMESTMPQH